MKSRQLITLAIASSIALAACSGTVQTQPTSAADPAFGAQWQAENFSTFYSQQISWHDCTEDDGLIDEMAEGLEQLGVSKPQCATIQAPLNWADPSDERTVDLAISRVASTGAEPGRPLFGNPGGPGESGINYALTLPFAPNFDMILDSFDVWGLDPRGVGGSTPVECEPESQVRAVRLSECIVENPVAHHMGTSQVARDLELLRALSGAEQFDYLGYSYGTMLGATYATLFPDKAGRMILDSAEDAQWASPIHSFDQQVAVARAAGALVTGCPQARLEDGSTVMCPFDSEDGMVALIDALNESPWTASNGTEFAGGDLVGYITTALYSPPTEQARLLDLLGKATTGDQAAIDAVAEELAQGRAEVGLAGDITICHSFPNDPQVTDLVDHMESVGVPAFVGGPEVTDEVLSEYADLSCAVLPEAGQDITDTFDASAVTTPLLVFGVTGDHATPYQYSQSLTQQLGKAVLVSLEGAGHGASFAGRSTCIDQVAADYLLHGTVPEAGMVCTDD